MKSWSCGAIVVASTLATSCNSSTTAPSPTPAAFNPLRWHLTATFDDGGTAVGDFACDSAARMCLYDFSIQTSGGNVKLFSPYLYVPGNSNMYVGPQPITNVATNGVIWAETVLGGIPATPQNPTGAGRTFSFMVASPLSTVLTTIPIVLGDRSNENLNGPYRLITSGSVSSAPLPIPCLTCF
jgi:hypothetical protein